MEHLQLELFPETIEERQTREIKELKESLKKINRSLHAKNGALTKAYNDIYHEFETFKKAICKGTI